MIGPHSNKHVARQRVAFSWQVLPIAHRLNNAIKNKAKSVAYATYTELSTSTLTTEPFLKSHKSGSSRLQPLKPPRRCARYTNLMACDLARSDVLASERDHGLSKGRIARLLTPLPPALLGKSRAIHDGMATKNTTYNWVCKPHTIYIQYDPNVHLSKVRGALPIAI